MKTWYCGKTVDVKVGQKVLIYRVSSGLSYFGEFATLKTTTKMHMVFVTESGAVVKTKIDNLHDVVGKAKANGYSVSLHVDGVENDKNFIHSKVMFWNDKKCCFETK